jgi:hypothetical protein
MTRSILCLWLGAIALGCASTFGCKAPEQDCSKQQVSFRPPSVISPYTPVQREVVVAQIPVATEPPVTTPEVVVTTHQATEDGSVKVAAKFERQMGSAWMRENAGRRSFADITANPAWAHDVNYQWVVGTLEQGKDSNTWSVRYGRVDEDDRYGGHVTLVNPGPLSGLQAGQLVRVDGQPLDPNSTEDRPQYQVRSIAAAH